MTDVFSYIGLITACITSVLFLNSMFISEYYIIAYILKRLILKQCAFYLRIMSKKKERWGLSFLSPLYFNK